MKIDLNDNEYLERVQARIDELKRELSNGDLTGERRQQILEELARMLQI